MQLNQANLLTWYDKTPDGAFMPLPVAGIPPCRAGIVVWVRGEEMSFHINTPDGIVMDDDIDLILMVVYTLDKIPQGSAGYANVYRNPDYFTNNKIYGTLTCPDLPNGDYVLGFYAVGDDEDTLIYSSPIYICGNEALTETAVFEYRNPYNKNNIEYATEELQDFYHRFRLYSSFHTQDVKVEKSIIDDMDAQKPREFGTTAKMGYVAVVSAMDQDKHFAMTDMVASREMKINGNYYQCESGYTPQPIERSGHSKGEMTVYRYDLRQVNRWPVAAE